MIITKAMIMTNANSIQDVLFFPQMRPEKKIEIDSDEKFLELGIPLEWIPLVQKSGVLVISDLKDLNPNKLHQDLCGVNKKNKLGLKNPSQDEVKEWIAKQG